MTSGPLLRFGGVAVRFPGCDVPESWSSALNLSIRHQQASSHRMAASLSSNSKARRRARIHMTHDSLMSRPSRLRHMSTSNSVVLPTCVLTPYPAVHPRPFPQTVAELTLVSPHKDDRTLSPSMRLGSMPAENRIVDGIYLI
jgi:hypothetical protein